MDISYIKGVGGILKTRRQFVFVLGETFYGPYPNERFEEITRLVLNIIREVDISDTSDKMDVF